MEKEYIHIVYDYVTHIENAHIISKQTFTLLKLYYKILEEKAEKRAKNELFKPPCKYFVIKQLQKWFSKGA